jgi:O-antigen/teichoic acid export membrane protein
VETSIKAPSERGAVTVKGSTSMQAGSRPARGANDFVTILSGTLQNVAGIAIAALAMFVVQVLMTRRLGSELFGVVTLLTQGAFVASFATRSGMDMAVLRDVAIDAGTRRWGHIRVMVARAAGIAAGVSALAAILAVASGSSILHALHIPDVGAEVILAAALGLPFLATANVWLAATRGLKIMRYTLYVFWAGQNLVWILLLVILWWIEPSRSPTTSVLAYSLSWVWAAGLAAFFWRRECSAWDKVQPEPGWLGKLLRYAGPRAPAALLAQLLFWTDLFVLTQFRGASQVGIYSAVLRAGQVMMLFLTSVNMMFGPFVADLHNRGQRDHLDALYKTLTRWIVAATLPLFLLLAIAPSAVMRVFGEEFSTGQTALLVLLGGQFVNIATGSAGFILVMVGRTEWDLAIYAGSVVLDVALALWLCPRYGITGAAIANAVTFACSNCARLIAVKRFVDIQPYDRRYARLVLPTLIAAAVMWLLHASLHFGYLGDLLVIGSVGGLVYTVCYALFGLTPEERRGARALWQRVTDRAR